MSEKLISRNSNLEDDNILTSKYKLIGLINNELSCASSSTYKINQVHLLYDHSNQRSIEEFELAEFVASMLRLENSKRQLYTNPLWQRIRTDLLPLPSLLSEVSNQAINASFISLINNFISQLKIIYILKNPVEVVKYLNEKKHLIYLLLDINQKIKEIFPNEKLVLKVLYDPEIAGWRKLLIDIHTLLNVDEAFEKLKILDESWWIDVSCNIGNDLEIHISFDEV